MPTVPLERVRPDDVLAEDVVAGGQRLLCARGTRLEPAIAERLRRNGVTTVHVVARNAGATSPTREVSLAQADEVARAVRARFAHAGGGEDAALLLEAAVRALIAHAAPEPRP